MGERENNPIKDFEFTQSGGTYQSHENQKTEVLENGDIRSNVGNRVMIMALTTVELYASLHGVALDDAKKIALGIMMDAAANGHYLNSPSAKLKNALTSHSARQAETLHKAKKRDLETQNLKQKIAWVDRKEEKRQREKGAAERAKKLIKQRLTGKQQ